MTKIEKRVFEDCDDYWVSDDGRVFSYKRGTKQELTQSGVSRCKRYKVVTLSYNGVSKKYYVHRLVGEAFIPKSGDRWQINHKDRNPENNHVDNLEWVTSQENIIHSRETAEYKECLICSRRIWTKRSIICSDCKDDIITKIEAILISEANNQHLEILANVNPLKRTTNKQKEVLAFISEGYTQAEIARKLNVSRQRIGQVLKSCFKQ